MKATAVKKMLSVTSFAKTCSREEPNNRRVAISFDRSVVSDTLRFT